MKAIELQQYFRSLGRWVDPIETVDTFKAGDPEVDITGIAVGWMSYLSSLQAAKDLNCNLFVTHEPTYYNHREQDHEIFRIPQAAEKQKWVAENGITIVRCHDLWDQYPTIGIPDAWASQLGLSDPVYKQGFYRVFEVTGHTAYSLARQVAERTRHLGQEAVQLVGPSDSLVTKVAIGTGAITPFLQWVETFKVDLAICTDDGFTYWRDAAFAIDHGISVIVVNHPVAEIYGIQLLAEHLRMQFPQVPVHYIPQSCMYQLVHA